ncbi:GntR family transcriptional regulator [Corallococcus macrosporus]|uniref:GntR family transcriptional regulator n=1 Tax=Corallococcus macrosporus TaxID=35 RepID=A0ABS3DQ70_9BACT|nr:GntR family transcriptional regulator [Corallococcus macrosporus]MBN8233466.1 GntR family transcriptional regulator [Corallococcus macrosporus]
MVRVGLVAYVEQQIEQDIALGRLPRNGRLASERVMAHWYGVSRGTVREALRRLAARGLVVQHPGRQARAVALDESLTLENLGLALHAARSEEGRRLLEGFFSLKRQVLAELLADCCANASESEVGRLESVCYALWDAARWHPGERCAQLEFELLRLAAQVAARPGHLLLIQSLQRAFRGIEARLLPVMGGEALGQWARCAMHALNERDMQALQHQLPVLLKACDARVLGSFAPRPRENVSAEAPEAQECSPGAHTSTSAQDNAPEALTRIEMLEPGNCQSVTGQAESFEEGTSIETRGSSAPLSAAEQDEALAAISCVEEHGIGVNVQADAAPGAVPCAPEHAVSMEPDSEVPGFTSAPGLSPREPGGEGTGGIQSRASHPSIPADKPIGRCATPAD